MAGIKGSRLLDTSSESGVRELVESCRVSLCELLTHERNDDLLVNIQEAKSSLDLLVLQCKERNNTEKNI